MKLRSPEKEAEIHKVVLDITYEVGLAGLKMTNIAKRAGLAHGTVYIYFDNKKDLINKVFRKVKQKAVLNMGTNQAITGDFKEELKGIWTGFIHYLLNFQKEIHFMKQCLESPFLEKAILEIGDSSKRHLVDFFEKGKREKHIKNLDTELLLSLHTGLASDLIEKINAKQLKYSDQLVNDSFMLCWNAMKK